MDSYIIRSYSTGWHICWSERNICSAKDNANTTGSDIDPDTVANAFSVSVDLPNQP